MSSSDSSSSNAPDTDDNASNTLLPLVENDDDDDNNDTGEVLSFPLCRISRNRRLVLLKPALFFRKVVLVFLASYALLPLLAYKSDIPGVLYASLLIVIHVGVLFVYLYRVTFGKLDVDRLSLGGRILGLAVVAWLLTVVSGWEDRTHIGVLAVQMLVLCLVHTFMLSLLMVAVEPLNIE